MDDGSVSFEECKRRVEARDKERENAVAVFREILTLNTVGDVLDDDWYERAAQVIESLSSHDVDKKHFKEHVVGLRKEFWDKVIDSIFHEVDAELKK